MFLVKKIFVFFTCVVFFAQIIPNQLVGGFNPGLKLVLIMGIFPKCGKKNTSELTGASADLFSDDPENSHDRFPPKGGFSKGNPWKSPYFRKI